MTTNIFGDVHSRVPTDKFKDNYDAIFGKKAKPAEAVTPEPAPEMLGGKASGVPDPANPLHNVLAERALRALNNVEKQRSARNVAGQLVGFETTSRS